MVAANTSSASPVLQVIAEPEETCLLRLMKHTGSELLSALSQSRICYFHMDGCHHVFGIWRSNRGSAWRREQLSLVQTLSQNPSKSAVLIVLVVSFQDLLANLDSAPDYLRIRRLIHILSSPSKALQRSCKFMHICLVAYWPWCWKEPAAASIEQIFSWLWQAHLYLFSLYVIASFDLDFLTWSIAIAGFESGHSLHGFPSRGFGVCIAEGRHFFPPEQRAFEPIPWHVLFSCQLNAFCSLCWTIWKVSSAQSPLSGPEKAEATQLLQQAQLHT